MDIGQIQFLNKASQQAEQAGHIFPDMAACEAGEESNFGKSRLAIEANNLFGMKMHDHIHTGSVTMPTKEVLHGTAVIIGAVFIKYPDQAACFADRVATLTRLAPYYPHYAAALTATDPMTYVTEVSKSWSTDQRRAEKVIHWYTLYTSYKEEQCNKTLSTTGSPITPPTL